MDATLAREAYERSLTYLRSLADRPVAPTPEAIAGLSRFDEPLPSAPLDPLETLRLLDTAGSPATMATAGGRFFGFVIGGSLPSALAAHWLASAWDQNAGLVVSSPVSAKLEEVSLRWLVELFGLPRETGGAFVTGATTASFTCLAAARHAVLRSVGWDVESEGLFGAPPVTVVVGAEFHIGVRKALGLLGLGRDRVVTVPADSQGRMRFDLLPPMSGPTIVCVQAGNVNSGSFDPLREITEAAHASGAWVHVDGAFGLWAAASPRFAHLSAGIELADSWATDAHKWLNVPYDSGIGFVRKTAELAGAMSFAAAYLPESGTREPSHMTPELSRRARGIDVWAALRTLGRNGITAMVEGSCAHAQRFADGFRRAGHAILNDVVLNQVLVDFGSPEATQAVIAEIQREGTAWCGGTVWQGKTAMRISVSSWATTTADVDRCLEAMLGAAARVTGKPAK